MWTNHAFQAATAQLEGDSQKSFPFVEHHPQVHVIRRHRKQLQGCLGAAVPLGARDTTFLLAQGQLWGVI